MVNEKRNAIIGLVLWVVFVLAKTLTTSFDSLQYVEVLLMFAYLVLVPLTLSFVTDQANRFYRWACMLQPIAATLAGISFFLPQGVIATMLAFPWFIVTIFIALFGFTRFVKRKQWFNMSDNLIHIGLMYIVVGGGWLLLHRTGIGILHFNDIIVLLTSIHFHYAAFITPITMGIVGKKLIAIKPAIHSLYTVLAIMVMLGPIFVAIGITYGNISPVLEFTAVIEFVTPLLLYAVLVLAFLVPRLSDRYSQVFFSVSSLSLLFSMGAAFIYGYGHLGGSEHAVLGIPLMVFVHGFVNTFGFSLFSILGILQQRSRRLI